MKNKKKRWTVDFINREFAFLDKRMEKAIKWVDENRANIDPAISYIQAVELFDYGIDVTQLKPKQIAQEHEPQLNISENSDSFTPYKDSVEEKESMSLEEKILKMQLNINKVNLSPLQMEVVIGAMKELTIQRKIGNWTNKIM